MLFKLVLIFCFVGASLAGCQRSIQGAWFKGACSSGFSFFTANMYSFWDLKYELRQYWQYDIQNSVSRESSNAINGVKDYTNGEVNKLRAALSDMKAEQDGQLVLMIAQNSTLINSTRSYVDQELSKMNLNITEQQDRFVSDLLKSTHSYVANELNDWKLEQDRRITQVLANTTEVISKLGHEIQQLKQAIEQLKNHPEPVVKETTVTTAEEIPHQNKFDTTNRSLVLRVCEMRKSLGMSLNTACKEVMNDSLMTADSEA